MKTIILLLALTGPARWICAAQPAATVDPGQAVKDSLAMVKMVEDSVKFEKLMSLARFPLLKGSKWSGVLPVADPTEIPDNSHEYKLLFEVTAKNPDSLTSEINFSLDEIARILNLHIASGILAEKIKPVVVIHGPGLEAVSTNMVYLQRHSIDNPNLKLVREMEKVGTNFIACGQAMAYFGFEKEDLLPEVRITLTAQTVLSNYQSKGYVLFPIKPER